MRWGLRTLGEQFRNQLWRSLECGIDLRLVFSAGFGDLGLSASGATHEFGHSTHQLARLDALNESWRDTRDERDLALRLS